MTLDLGIITDSLSPAAGGLFESVRLPANKLAAEGARVTVHGVWDRQFDANRAAWQGPAVEVSRVRGPQFLRVAPGLLDKVMAADHDVLHQHGLWLFPSYVTDRWRRKTGRPAVVSPRGMLDPWALARSASKKRVARLLFEDRNLRGAAAVHALNASEAAAIRAFGLANPIAIIPNGVEMPDRAIVWPSPGFMGEDQRRVVLFLGRLHAKKGLCELIAAWSEVVRQRPALSQEWRLVIAGWDDGGHETVVLDAIAGAGLGRHVTLAGPLRGEAKAATLSHASAFILPSYSEGMPMAVLEAWSYGLPVFMTAACNLPQGFAAGAAIEIETDPAAMASVLAAALEDREVLADIGRKGHALVAAKYTWDRIVADMRRLYGWLGKGGPQPEFIV